MTEHRDPVVAGVLRRLDVPDHRADFWDDLDARLLTPGAERRDELADADAGEPAGADVLDLATSPVRDRGSARRHRPPVLALVAAVAVVVALVVGVAVLGPVADDESRLDTANDPSAPEPDAGEPEPDQTSDTTQPQPPAVDPAEARSTAERWLTLLEAGDVEDAHALLDETSRARLPLAAFRDVATGLAEGAAAFAGADADTFRIDPASGSTATVVVFRGEVEREGMVETAAYPVVVTPDGSGGPRIAFVLDGPPVSFEALSSPSETRTSPVRATTPETAEVWVRVDGSEPERTIGGPVLVDVEAAAGAGTHVVTVVAAEDGVLTARSVTVVVP